MTTALFDPTGAPNPAAIPETVTAGIRRLAAAVDGSRRRAAGEDRITRAFTRFHAAHPEVYELLVTLCRRAKSRGVERLGIGMLWEVLRWELTLAGLPDPREGFKLNNSYRSRYARLIMDTESDLAGVFATRELRSL